jgi:hypothetical protein
LPALLRTIKVCLVPLTVVTNVINTFTAVMYAALIEVIEYTKRESMVEIKHWHAFATL